MIYIHKVIFLLILGAYLYLLPAFSSINAVISFGDIDGDGLVGLSDYNVVVANFGKSGTGILGDFDNNGNVGLSDYNILVTNYGKVSSNVYCEEELQCPPCALGSDGKPIGDCTCITIKKCQSVDKTSPTPSQIITQVQCNGVNDTSCPAGYRCVQNCGSPVARLGDSDPGYSCLQNDTQQFCPVCLPSGTLIQTPQGEIAINQLKKNMMVFTQDVNGKKIVQPIVAVSKTAIVNKHTVIKIDLFDGRTVTASGGHPISKTKTFQSVVIGNMIDGTFVTHIERLPYTELYTYDILPGGDTGNYWANGVLIGSTLKK